VDKFDFNYARGYTTRNGQAVKLYSENNGGNYPIHGALKCADGNWQGMSWTKDGTYYFTGTPSDYDLIPVMPKIVKKVRYGIVDTHTNTVEKNYLYISEQIRDKNYACSSGLPRYAKCTIEYEVEE